MMPSMSEIGQDAVGVEGVEGLGREWREFRRKGGRVVDKFCWVGLMLLDRFY